MIVTAALPWWNELPEDLYRCVTAAGLIADRIVALDGAYSRYPGATNQSDPGQAAAIREAADKVGMECKIIVPRRLWDGQIEKRCQLLEYASQETDWIATIDADHIIQTDRLKARDELEHTFATHKAVPYVTPSNDSRPIEESAPGLWHAQQQSVAPQIPHLWKPVQGLRVEIHHWWYSGIVGGYRHWLWATGGDMTYPHLSWEDMRTPYIVEHRTLFRTTEQVLASRAFLNDREKVVELTGQEDDRAWLARPIYDFQRLPE